MPISEPSRDEYVQQITGAIDFIRRQLPESFKPKVAIVLGSGLGELARLIEPVAEIPYNHIPLFPTPTVPGHEGKLIAGTLSGIPLLGFKGRKHYYEVAHLFRPMNHVVFPVHVAADLGCKLYIATNAAGGLNPEFHIGDIMMLRSHISFFLPNPLSGPHHNFNGNDYFQPLADIYPEKLRKLFRGENNTIHEGVYAAVTGRTFETQAECLMLRTLGVDAVGMSTVPEVIVARNRNMETFATSIITNVIAADGTNATNHEEVTAILHSKQTEMKLFDLFRNFFEKLQTAY